MRILHIITRLILGGAQQNTLLCCRGQVQAGHHVALAYGPIYGPEGSLLDQARDSDASLYEVASMRRAVLPIHDLLCYRALCKLIRQFKPDLVHTHSSKAGIVGRAAAWSQQVPAIIHTIHGLPFHPRNSALVNQLYIASERWAARRCDRIVGVTDAMCDQFLDHRIGQPDQYCVVPSGMDIDSFLTPADTRRRIRQELGIPDQALVLGCVARLDKLKGQCDLIDVLPALLTRYPQTRLLLVGDGWYRPALEQQARQLNLSQHIHFTGLLPPQRVPDMLAAMDVHALASYQEGQPRTLVQASLAGLPIVGYDAGGIKDVCLHQTTGLLVPLGDRPALTQALDQLLSDPAMRQRLGNEGQRLARLRYDWKTMVGLLEQIYRDTLHHSPRKRA